MTAGLAQDRVVGAGEHVVDLGEVVADRLGIDIATHASLGMCAFEQSVIVDDLFGADALGTARLHEIEQASLEPGQPHT